MNNYEWLLKNCGNLSGRKIAVTGSTGGIGRVISRYFAYLGAELILVDRNANKSSGFSEELKNEFPGLKVTLVTADMEDIASVKNAVDKLSEISPDFIVLNAAVYAVPLKKCSTGYNNVFQTDFVSPYYLVKELLPVLRNNGGGVIAVGSIAHNYSKRNPLDIDLSNEKSSALIYGNAKRYLMFALFELFKNETEVSLAVAHPGITFTNITAHYPKFIFALIKHPMKIIFMKPEKAARSIVSAAFSIFGYKEWMGPSVFDVWGNPKIKPLKTCSDEESGRIFRDAEQIYMNIKK